MSQPPGAPSLTPGRLRPPALTLDSTDKVAPNAATPPKTPTHQYSSHSHSSQPATPRRHAPYRPRFTLVDRTPGGRYVARPPPPKDHPTTIWGVVLTITPFKEQFALWDEIELDNRLLKVEDVQAGLYIWRMDQKEEDMEMMLGDWLCKLRLELSRWLEEKGHTRFRNAMSQFWMSVEDDMTKEIVQEGSSDPQLQKPLRQWFHELRDQHYFPAQCPNPVPLHLKVTWVTPKPFCLVGLENDTYEFAESLDVTQKGRITRERTDRCTVAGVILPEREDCPSQPPTSPLDLRPKSPEVPNPAGEEVIQPGTPIPRLARLSHADSMHGIPLYMLEPPPKPNYHPYWDHIVCEEKHSPEEDICPSIQRLFGRLPVKLNPLSPRSPKSPTTLTKKRSHQRTASGTGVDDDPQEGRDADHAAIASPASAQLLFSPSQGSLQLPGDALLPGGIAPHSPSSQEATSESRVSLASSAIPSASSHTTTEDPFALPASGTIDSTRHTSKTFSDAAADGSLAAPLGPPAPIVDDTKTHQTPTKDVRSAEDVTSVKDVEHTKSLEPTKDAEPTKDTIKPRTLNKRASRVLLHKISAVLSPKKSWYGGSKKKKDQEKNGEKPQKKDEEKTGVKTTEEAPLQTGDTAQEPRGEVDAQVARERSFQGHGASQVKDRDTSQTDLQIM
ncbi:hypothetical protein IAR50_002839 [Cryptococcus sp. DSM 104548]